jgi:mannose-6-phosphate isomerase-like protein (cupin superfamily)
MARWSACSSAEGKEPLSAVAVTMPPWPGKNEAIVVPGPWEPSLE